METTLEHRIRERAYFLSQSGGGADDGTHFWLIAERDVLAEVAMESAATSQLSEAMQLAETAKPTPVLRATKQQPAAEQPKEAALKPRAAAKGSAKTSTKATPPAAAAAVKSAVVTPIKSATKTRAHAAAR